MHFVWKWPGMMVGALAAAQLSSAEAAAVVPEPSCRHCAAEFGSPEFRPVVVLQYYSLFGINKTPAVIISEAFFDKNIVTEHSFQYDKIHNFHNQRDFKYIGTMIILHHKVSEMISQTKQIIPFLSCSICSRVFLVNFIPNRKYQYLHHHHLLLLATSDAAAAACRCRNLCCCHIAEILRVDPFFQDYAGAAAAGSDSSSTRTTYSSCTSNHFNASKYTGTHTHVKPYA